jgi:hypothetical protein
MAGWSENSEKAEWNNFTEWTRNLIQKHKRPYLWSKATLALKQWLSDMGDYIPEHLEMTKNILILSKHEECYW